MTAHPPHTTTMPATDKQVDLIKLLASTVTLEDAQAVKLQAQMVEGVNMHEASEIITTLKMCPHSFPDGHYAVPVEDKILFFMLSTSRSGAWRGTQFVRRQAGPELFPVRFDGAARVYQMIREYGIRKSLELYGQTIGVCACCGKALTDTESRRIGIGPICLGKLSL